MCGCIVQWMLCVESAEKKQLRGRENPSDRSQGVYWVCLALGTQDCPTPMGLTVHCKTQKLNNSKLITILLHATKCSREPGSGPKEERFGLTGGRPASLGQGDAFK